MPVCWWFPVSVKPDWEVEPSATGLLYYGTGSLLGSERQTLSQNLNPGLKPISTTEYLVSAGSDGPEPFYSYAAIGSDRWGPQSGYMEPLFFCLLLLLISSQFCSVIFCCICSWPRCLTLLSLSSTDFPDAQTCKLVTFWLQSPFLCQPG